ncbi:MAG: 50S ribosomal protein L4 [Candidatus Paceibacterota bacterium]|jgi:large subunit ribosomal protein L4
MDATIYNKEGKSAGKIALSEKAFGLSWNADLVHQVMVSMMSNARQPIAHTKTRGEVRGGGKKPWRQKGTGRARHGSTRSPLWVGGGVAHGPRNDKEYGRKVNKAVKSKAFLTVLSKKWRDGEVLFVDSLSFDAPKTATAKSVLVALGAAKGFEKLATKRKNAAFIAFAKKDENAEKSFRNIGSVVVDEVRNINLLDLLNNKFIVIENPVESVKVIEAKL